jgi:hypothetical protein
MCEEVAAARPVGAVPILAAIVSAANESPAVRRMMAGWNRKVALTIDGFPFTILALDGRASLVEAAVESATPSFTLSLDTLELLRDRRITPLMAKMKGLIHSTGSIVDILRFSSLLSASVQFLAANSAR